MGRPRKNAIISENKTAKKRKRAASATPATHLSVYVTPQGLKETKQEVAFLINTRRKEVADRIQRAREYGDLAENSEYDAAMEEQALVENRIAELEGLLTVAKVIADNVQNDFVVIGSTVKIEMDGEVDEFTIVGRLEADPSKKKISNESPVGAALLGAKVGETVEVATPIVRYKCKVIEVK